MSCALHLVLLLVFSGCSGVASLSSAQLTLQAVDGDVGNSGAVAQDDIVSHKFTYSRLLKC